DVVHADGDVGGDHRVAAAQQLVQRRPVELAPQVVYRDLDSGLGAGVLFHRALDQVGDAVEVGDLLADQARRDVVSHRVDDGAVGVAGDHGGGGSAAVADLAGIGVDHHHHVLDLLDGAQGGLEGRFQRHAEHAEADIGDFHFCLAKIGRAHV